MKFKEEDIQMKKHVFFNATNGCIECEHCGEKLFFDAIFCHEQTRHFWIIHNECKKEEK